VTQIGDGQIQAAANCGSASQQTSTVHSSTAQATGSASRTTAASSATTSGPVAFTGAASVNKPAVAMAAGLIGFAALF